MPAQVCGQDPKVKELFQRAIKAKMERTKSRVMDNFEDEVPSWAAAGSLVLLPLIGRAAGGGAQGAGALGLSLL